MKRTMRFMGIALFAVLIITGLNSCKKDDKPGDDNKEEVKKLTKSQLYDKTWYNEGGTISLLFKTGGVYNVDGSWKWIGNSDSMEVVQDKGGTPFLFYFHWSSEHEIEWSNGGKDEPKRLYKDEKW